MRLACALALLLAIPVMAAAQDNVLRKTTHVYKTVDGTSVHADVHHSARSDKRPVLVWIHGGALIVGSRNSVPKQLMDLARNEDYVVVSIDYRLGPEAKLPAIADDVTDALAWVRAKGPTLFGADPERIAVSGGSAGGYLTLLAGTRAVPRPRALVAYWGYGDVDGDWYTKPSTYYRTIEPLIDRAEALKAIGPKVLTHTEDAAVQKARGRLYRYYRQNGLWTKEVTGFDPATERAKLDSYCPIRSIPDDYPPTLMVHGTKDDDVPYEQSEAMAKALAARKLPHELVTVPGAGHGLSGGDSKQAAAAHQRALTFIRERLR